ncbi:MAG: hypothetical protein Kow0062_24690 [Acidobacteriota bacterium]
MSLIRGGSFSFEGSAIARDADPSVEILSGWPAVSAVREIWEALLADYRHPAPGLTWAALDAVAAALDGTVTPLVVCAPDAHAPRVLLALQCRRVGPLRIVEPLGRDLLPRHEPLVSREGMELPPVALVRAVARRLGHDAIFDLPRLRPGARGTRWLVDGLSRAPGWGVLHGPGECQLPLAGGWPRVEASLPVSMRRAARAGAERARADGVELDIRLVVPHRRGELDDVIELGGDDLDPRSATRRDVLHRLVESSAASGRLRAALVRAGDRLLAGTVVWIGARQAVELVAGADPSAERYAPQEIADLALLETLSRREQLDGLLMARDRGPARPLPPDPQPRLLGAPQPGLARLLAGAAHRALEGEDLLLDGLARLVRRLLEARDRRAALAGAQPRRGPGTGNDDAGGRDTRDIAAARAAPAVTPCDDDPGLAAGSGR